MTRFNMRTILGITFVLFAAVVCAEDVTWHEGSVVLASKEVVVGQIARQSHELLLLKNAKGEVSVLPAHKVCSFRYYDRDKNVNRIFITASNKFFERVVSGKISVWRIQKFFDQNIDEENTDLYDFFIEDEKTIYSLNSFRKKFFGRIKDELELNLVSYKHLDPNTRYGALSLIVLYNKSTRAII